MTNVLVVLFLSGLRLGKPQYEYDTERGFQDSLAQFHPDEGHYDVDYGK